MKDMVSIIIPCFRGERHLSVIIDDIKRQTHENWELIVVGNGPGQEAQRVVAESAAAADGRIAYVSISEAGVSRARNVGMGRASGRWVAFADVDDRVPTNWLENYLCHASRNPDMIVGGICYRDLRTGKTRRADVALPSDEVYSESAAEYIPLFLSDVAAACSPCSKLYGRPFLEAAKVLFREDISVYEDAIFNYELALKCRSMCIVRQTGYEYCRHGAPSAIRRHHACMDTALEARRALLGEVLVRGAYADDIAERLLADRFAGDSLDVLLNEMRPGAASGLWRKVRIARRLFTDPQLSRAWKLARPPLSNPPLVLYRVFHFAHLPLLCVAAFEFLFWIRRVWRRDETA